MALARSAESGGLEVTADVVREVVLQGLVPCVLVIGALTGWLAASVVPAGDARNAAYAGSWAGLFAATGYAIPATNGTITLHLPPVLGVVGLGIGLAGPILFLILRRNRAIGLLCLLQVFGALAGLVTLYAVPSLHGATAWLSLSDAFGTCLIFLLPRRSIDRLVTAARRPRSDERLRDVGSWPWRLRGRG